jgi:hypothetical protein
MAQQSNIPTLGVVKVTAQRPHTNDGNNVFRIGTLDLSRFEVPEEFGIGHELHLATHKFISENGVPVIKVHAMGAFPLPVTWKGILYGAGALNRMQQLDRICTNQQPVVWQYCQFRYNVIVSKFTATVMYQTEVRYEIEVTVIQDLNGSDPFPFTQQTFDLAIQGSFYQANTYVATLQGIDPLLPANIVAEAAAIQTSLLGLYPLAAAQAVDIEALINDIIALNRLLGGYVTPLQSAAVLEADLAKLNAGYGAMQYYGVLATNLGILLGQGTQAKQVSASAGSNLFAIAAQQYPKADLQTAVQAIAQANRLNDYFVYEDTLLTIPPILT